MISKLSEVFKGRDVWWGPITVLLIGSLIGFACYALGSGKSLDSASLVIGGLISNAGLMLNFRYGSSKGSKDKDSKQNETK